MDHQDWKPVFFQKSQKQLKKEGKLKYSKIKSNKRPNSNKKKSVNISKLDGNEIVKPLYIPKDIRLQIQQARCAQNLSQKDLANRLSVKKSIINDLESGKLLMNKTFIKKVKNILNIK